MDQERLLEYVKARVDALCELASKLKDEPVDVDNSIPQVDDALLKRCGTNIPALINELTGHDGKMKDKNDDEGKNDEDKKDGGKDGDVPLQQTQSEARFDELPQLPFSVCASSPGH